MEIIKRVVGKIDDELDCGMSLISARLYVSVDDEDVKNRRQANAKYLVERLSEKGIQLLLPIAEGKVPLFVPIILDNRDIVRKAMFQREIFCPGHWPLEGMPVKKGKEMTEHELSLIVDQRYDVKDMEEIIKML